MKKHTPGPWVARPVQNPSLKDHTGYAIDFNADQEQVVDFVYEQADAVLIAAAPQMLDDLIAAAAQFRKYEALHRAKGTPDSLAKAKVNADLASRFEQTIAKATA
ncbi:hypothetical protein Q6A49_12685 [Pseudomonas sp. 22-AL-CL-001]|uniref:hypothetical protein n=1 Tax=Pseudomonas alabamensis TaxID=3064349 RepID=UPI00271364CA|nr:hypothetical protein [Pseudomonas sp. 22-AL-CL-001]MDO7911390.1 hypothetical protein [Pseudomonas sp. 22-AL-CL-001]